jgi:serine/threonine protein kinase
MSTHTNAQGWGKESLHNINQLHERFLQLARSSTFKQIQQVKKSDLSPSNALFFKSLDTVQVKEYLAKHELKLTKEEQQLNTVLKHEPHSASFVTQVQEYLREVHSPFICHSLYYDKEGYTIARKTGIDLFVYRNNHRIKFAEFQHLVGQLILMVEALHEKNLVHRDFKPENILVIEREGKLYLLLTDLYSLARVNGENQISQQDIDHRFASTIHHECPDRYASLPFQKVRKDKSKYAKLDLKAEECYALGGTLIDVAILCSNLDKSQIKLYQTLIKILRENGTIQKAKAQSFFGETEEERKNFFDELVIETSRDVYIDGFLVESSSSKPGHPFYLLNPKLKQVDLLVRKIKEQIECLQCFQGEKRVLDFDDSAPILQKNLQELDRQIGDIQKDESLLVIHGVVQKIRDHASAVSKVFFLTSGTLQDIVGRSVNEYIKANKLNEPRNCLMRFFSFHGETGRKRAEKLRTDVVKAVEQGKSPAEVFALILQALTTDGGRWWEHSFKTMLAKHLKKQGSELPYAEWSPFLSQASRSHEQGNECNV